MLAGDIDLCKQTWCAFAQLFRPRAALEAELLVLRHQLNVLRPKSPGRLALSSIDRLAFAGMTAATIARRIAADEAPVTEVRCAPGSSTNALNDSS